MLARLFIAPHSTKKFEDRRIVGLFTFSKHPLLFCIQDEQSLSTLWMEVFPPEHKMQFNVVDDLLYFDGVEEVYCLQFANPEDPDIVASSMNNYYERQQLPDIEQTEHYPQMNQDGTVAVPEPPPPPPQNLEETQDAKKRAGKSKKAKKEIKKAMLRKQVDEVQNI